MQQPLDPELFDRYDSVVMKMGNAFEGMPSEEISPCATGSNQLMFATMISSVPPLSVYNPPWVGGTATVCSGLTFGLPRSTWYVGWALTVPQSAARWKASMY